MFSPAAEQLHRRLEDRSAVVSVVGLGYVGLPLARAMHRAGFRVVGYDVDERKLEMLERGESYLKHLGEDLFSELAESDRFTPTTDPRALADADVVILCVPTPLGRHREPDMRFIVNSTRMVAETLHDGQLIVLESTTYPGTTRGDCLPILAETGKVSGEHFFVAFSPEREDPGRKDHDTQSIPKLVGGLDPVSTELATTLYRAAIQQVVPVESAEIAETAKLLENIYRAVNIALVNELKPLMIDMGIDVWKVVQAAATKPFGFQPFFPGPGLGGHCIPIDPFYLTWKAREFGHFTRFIELAGEINSAMPEFVVRRTVDALNDEGKAARGAKVLVVGIAYKPNVDDIRETPAAEIIESLLAHGVDVSYHDPHVPKFPGMRKYSIDLENTDLSVDTLKAADCVLIVTNHDLVDWSAIAENATLIVDTRNAMAAHGPVRGRIVQA